MARAVDRDLTGPDVGCVVEAAVEVGGGSVGEIESSVPGALAGDPAQVRAYVAAYRDLSAQMLDVVGGSRHNPRATAATSWVGAVLDREAMGAPFTAWAGALGVGTGVAVAIVAKLRELLPGLEPLAPPRGPVPDWGFDETAVARFYRAVLEELERSEAPLERIRAVLGINRTELARLFGVRRQAIDQWSARGVPGDRQEKLATLGEIADLLAAKLKLDRVPGVVRRRAPAYGGRSALAAIAEGEEERVLLELREAFDWATAA